MMRADRELLEAYIHARDERAFEELVSRHLGLVYAAALRRTGARTHAAEEVTQEVFTRLARHAPTLLRHTAISAWLHRCTRHAAVDLVRAEQRRWHLNQTYAAMPDSLHSSEPSLGWEKLRPVLDASIDDLSQHDRDVIVLRFFEALSFPELGVRLNIQENTARMRTTRALERLRGALTRRGMTSSTAALSSILGESVVSAAPPTLTASALSAVALASAPTGAVAGLGTTFLMSKITAPMLAAAVAAGLTALVWTKTVSIPDAAPLDASREENRDPAQQSTHAPSVFLGDPLIARVSGITRATSERRDAEQRGSRHSVVSTERGLSDDDAGSSRGHRYRGTDTPLNAAYSFAWACDVTDAEEISKLIWFPTEVRVRAQEILASMPLEIRAQYSTVEELYGMLIAADSLIFRPPVPEMATRFEAVELSETRVSLRLRGTNRSFHEYELTDGGWRFVMPLAGVERWSQNLNNPLLVKLSERAR